MPLSYQRIFIFLGPDRSLIAPSNLTNVTIEDINNVSVVMN